MLVNLSRVKFWGRYLYGTPPFMPFITSCFSPFVFSSLSPSLSLFPISSFNNVLASNLQYSMSFYLHPSFPTHSSLPSSVPSSRLLPYPALFLLFSLPPSIPSFPSLPSFSLPFLLSSLPPSVSSILPPSFVSLPLFLQYPMLVTFTPIFLSSFLSHFIFSSLSCISHFLSSPLPSPLSLFFMFLFFLQHRPVQQSHRTFAQRQRRPRQRPGSKTREKGQIEITRKQTWS